MPPKDDPAGGVIAADVDETRGHASLALRTARAGSSRRLGAVPRLKLFGSQSRGDVDALCCRGPEEALV